MFRISLHGNAVCYLPVDATEMDAAVVACALASKPGSAVGAELLRRDGYWHAGRGYQVHRDDGFIVDVVAEDAVNMPHWKPE